MIKFLHIIVGIILLTGVGGSFHNVSKHQELVDILFPNQQIAAATSERKLAGDDDILCVICRGLDYCQALNGFLIQEIYYPQPNAELGTCNILEALGKRMANEIFGIGKTFRDTLQCRDIVMQYLCLFWGSDNKMYVNECINKEDVSNPDPDFQQISPRPPCRSFCVQVAEVCANTADFMDLCYDIACPPKIDDCTPDPTVGGETVASAIECNVPYLKNPYSGAVTLPSPLWNMYMFILATIFLIVVF